jgi:hypothetical protein
MRSKLLLLGSLIFILIAIIVQGQPVKDKEFPPIQIILKGKDRWKDHPGMLSMQPMIAPVFGVEQLEGSPVERGILKCTPSNMKLPAVDSSGKPLNVQTSVLDCENGVKIQVIGVEWQ